MEEGKRTGSEGMRGLRAAVRALAPLIIVGGIALFYLDSTGFTFSSEDWTVVGPPAAKRFLDDPFSLFGFLGGGHFNPVGRAFFTAESLLFGTDPRGYHLVGLVLLASLSLLSLRFLRAFGVGFPAALLASFCFAVNWKNFHVYLQVYNHHYYLLGLLLLGSLLAFRGYLAGDGPRRLAWTAALAGTAQYVHSTAAVFPLILAVLLPFRWREGGQGERTRGEKARAILLLLGLALVLQGLPRLLLGAHLEGVAASPSLNLPGFVKTVGLAAAAWFQETRGFLFPAGFWTMVALVAAASAAWAARPRRGRVAAIGLAVLVLTLAPPSFALNWDPGFVATRHRYSFLPFLGAAMVLGVLLDALAGGGRAKWAEWAGKAAAGALVLLFLAASFAGNSIYYFHYRDQSNFVESAAAAWVETADRLSRGGECRTIRIRDYPLAGTAPDAVRSGVLLQGVNHQTLHRFFFAFDPRMLERFEFVPPVPSSGGVEVIPPCEFMVIEGRAY